MPIHSPSADLVSAVRLSTRQLPTSPPGLTRLGHSESEPDSCHTVARLLDEATSAPLPELPLQLSVVPANPDEPVDTTRGWQRPASRAIDESTAGRFRAMLDPPSLALLESQCGPFASRILTALPSCHELALDSPVFRALLLRRLRLPLPVDAAACRCHRPGDPLGDHRAACPRSGILRSRGLPLERAAARVCRKAGATMFWCATSTSTPSASMIAASRSSQMDSRSGAASNLLSIPPWSPLSMLVALHAGTSASTRAPLVAWHAGPRKAPALSCCALRLVAAGVLRPPSSFASSLDAGTELCLDRCGLQPLLPSLPTAARAFSASLLGLSLPGTANVDGFDEAPPVASGLPPRP